MIIALPVADGQLCMHFGHCQQFAFVQADPATGEIASCEYRDPPPHEPGVLPAWLAEHKVEVVLAGGMGQRAQQLFAANGIMVVTGAPAGEPKDLVGRYLANALEVGENVCDH
jgi:predicted Fe-Mo cluster-binding NifX family protein